MMKWPKKKASSSSSSITSSPSLSSSSSHAHLISHVFPISWFSKFKQTIEKPASRIPKTTQKNRETCEKSSQKPSSKQIGSYRGSRFYTKDDDDAFWRLSFGVEDEEVSKRERMQKGSERVGVDEDNKNESLQRTYRRIIQATSELQRELEQVRFDDEYRNSFDNKEHLQIMKMMGNKSEEWKQMKDAKKKEFLSKSEVKQRKSFHVSRDFATSGGSRMRARSPRTPSKSETCKVKALEKMKKAKMKKKMKEIETEKDSVSGLESFAVVKCSCNPQQDFRESMIEMIIEKRISKPEQLEELLACYLTLNADEHHDLIIKVFRQVWKDLEQVEFDWKLGVDHECCCTNV